MHDKEITTYLANVLYIASQDGRLTSQELAALDEVRRLVGAKRIHVTEATRLVEDAKFTARGVGTLGAQVRNLEDMVFVGLADADLVAGEREAIEVFCEQIGLTQTQLDQIVREAQVRCSDLELRASSAPEPTESKSDERDGGRGAGGDGAETAHPRQTAIARRACKTLIEDCRAAEIKSVELLPSNRDGEQCAMALSMRGTPLDIDRLPELPLPYCTARRCQCVWIAAG
ncbi:MAG TPA: hypothetical protein PK640_19400 [Verrucomicrobiota bacterium]|nr:hypothetical protein [Verrucomicrobiota bacterium]